MRRLTNWVYLLAVLAINFTLFRPSPVDVMFMIASILTLCSGQIFTRNIFILSVLLLIWLGSLLASSVPFIDDPEVSYQMVKISYAVSIGFCSSLVAAHWQEAELTRFLRIIVLATCAAASLGIAGFVLGLEELTWDGRAKAFLDDPNMYAAFLIPGMLGCMYLLTRRERPILYSAALALLMFGMMLSFSRAAIVSFLVWGSVYYVVINRRNLPRATLYAAAVLSVLAIAVMCGSIFIDGLAEKIADRTTVAKEYDLGHGGRYSRYLLSIPFILDNPLGMGLLQIDRYFNEPIHNIWVSSFLNYGWLAGIAFTLLIMFTVAISIANYRLTRNQIVLCTFFCWIAVLSCAFLHEAERWRHLWLFTGLVWGLNAGRLMARTPAREPAAPAFAGFAPPRPLPA
jgi:O-antigen ligase